MIITLTTTGYGDISVHSQWQKVYLSLIMLCANLLSTFILPQIAVFFTATDVVGKQAESWKQRVQNVIAVLEAEFDFLPHKLKNHIMTEQLACIEHDQGCFEQLSESTQEALKVALVNHVFFSENLSPAATQHFAGALVKKRFSPGQFVHITNEVVTTMYIFTSGFADVLNNNGEYKATLRRGNYFGKQALNGDELRSNTMVKALTHCAVFCLSVEHYRSLDTSPCPPPPNPQSRTLLFSDDTKGANNRPSFMDNTVDRAMEVCHTTVNELENEMRDIHTTGPAGSGASAGQPEYDLSLL